MDGRMTGDGFRPNIHQNQKPDKTFIIPDNRYGVKLFFGRGVMKMIFV